MTYFLVSDIHSRYTQFRKAIRDAGFRLNNPDHKLIILGDLFDRGDEPIELYHFLKKHKNKITIIKGNHEELFLDMVKRGYFEIHDYHNGTATTYMEFQLAGLLPEVVDFIRDIVNGPNCIEIGKYVLCHSTPEDTWGNPFLQNEIPGKIIVFGHWHTSWNGPEYLNKIYYGKGLVGIDAGFNCDQQVLVISDDSKTD